MNENTSKMSTNRQVIRDAAKVTALIIIGKILGFARGAVIAAYYGATGVTDAFFLASEMSGIMFPAVSNSFAIAFTSLYVSRIATEGDQNADRFASHMLNLLLGIGIVLGLIGVVTAPLVVPLFAPGFQGEIRSLAIYLTRLVMGSFVLIMAQYVLRAILNSRKFFIGPQVADLIKSLTIIVITIALGKGQSIEVLTLTVIGGSFLQVAIQAIGSRKHFSYSGFHREYNKDFKKLFRLALPILFGNSIIQINLIVDKALGSTLAAGSLSALSYASSLNSVVTSIFISALSTVLYPAMTEEAAKGNWERFGSLLLENLGFLTFILIPISSITIASRHSIVSFVYERGSFDSHATAITAAVLGYYAPYYAFSGMREVLNRGFFALQDTKTPMINGAIGVGCNVIFSIIFVRFFGIIGIALGTTLANVVITALLVYSAKRKMPFITINLFMKNTVKQIGAGLLTLAILFCIRDLLAFTSPLIHFLCNTLLGFGMYLLIHVVMKSSEIYQLIEFFKALLQKSR